MFTRLSIMTWFIHRIGGYVKLFGKFVKFILKFEE